MTELKNHRYTIFEDNVLISPVDMLVFFLRVCVLKLSAETEQIKKDWEDKCSTILQKAETSTLPGERTGYLVKEGSFFKSWKKRWFVFNNSTKVLSYFSDPSVYYIFF